MMYCRSLLMFLLLMLIIFPTWSASDDPYHGVYTGKVLLHDCEWAQDMLHKTPRLKEEDQNMVILYSARCIYTIDAVRDFAFFETDLVQNKEIIKGPFDLVSSAAFKAVNSFCLPKEFPKHREDIDAVVKYLYWEIDDFVKTYPGLPNAKDSALGLPAADYILKAFHEFYPCYK